MRILRIALCALVHAISAAAIAASPSDWPQFMKTASLTGDAGQQRLETPLDLVAQVKLDDAILTSPAVVDGRAYVVDQMGTAYCVDPEGNRIVWRTAPEGDAAFGSNTSSPCIASGKVFFGTTAGNLHIVDAASGRTIRSIQFGQPILSAITTANDSIYLQTLDAVVHCLDLDGNRRWRWDHYNIHGDRQEPKRKAHYGSAAVSVAGTRVVIAAGHDIVCVEDLQTSARHIWTQAQPIGDAYLPVATAIGGDYVYCAFPGKDGNGAFVRLSLRDGSFHHDRDVLMKQWAVLASPAVRQETAFFARQAFGMTADRFAGQGPGPWTSFDADHEPSGSASGSLTPSLSAPALSQEHCVFTTLNGELIVIHLPSATEVFRFRTAHGSVITSSPAIAGGRVHFGGDDGYLYVLGRGRTIPPKQERLTLHQPRSRVVPAGERRYGWPSAFGGPRNANFVDDPGLKPPFKVRWAASSGGLFKQPVCATEEDVVYCTLAGLVVCREQQTGRIRWRRKLPKQVWTRATLLLADGKVFVPRMFSQRYPKIDDQIGAMYCLDGENGAILWENPIGIGDRLRASPVFADGVVAFGSYYPQTEPERTIIPRNAAWKYLAGSDPPEGWAAPDFDDRDWQTGTAGFGYGDGDDRTELDMQGKYARVYIRKEFSGEDLAGIDAVSLMTSYDDGFIAYLNGREVARDAVAAGRGAAASGVKIHETEGFDRFSIDDWRELLRPGKNVLALEGHNTAIDSSDFSLHAYLVANRTEQSWGQVVDAWEAATGRHLWQIKVNTSGTCLNGPAGCAGDGLMFFTGGGESSRATGETLAILPRDGRVVWRTPEAFASQTGTPSFQDGKIYLPGTYRQPLACLSAADGRIVWQQQEGRNHWFIDTVSLARDYFTVNNKYQGGAIRWNLDDGTLAGTPERRIQLWGPAHGCGSVVLTGQGLALSATIDGLYMTDTSTGQILWNSPGFASYTCPHAIATNGRIFYCPQTSGIMFCFEPDKPH